MNSSYLEDPPSPHLHWHFIPRYKKPVPFHGKIFEDPCFGMSTMHNRGKAPKISEEFKKKIKNKIEENFGNLNNL
jgi:diadenosine tetraphosphate (Ap4A) HIT family hydrolase